MTENTFYLTKEGLEKTKRDYNSLLEFRKMKTTGEVPSIWHSEDVNPEYLSFQEDMSVLEARLTEYENILKNVELISLPPKGVERREVKLGATVTVDLGGEVDTFTIVGTLEADPLQKRISNESPIGNGLLGAKIDDVVKVKTTLVNHDCRILKIVYD
jgi:transcription elongation factor GreA